MQSVEAMSPSLHLPRWAGTVSVTWLIWKKYLFLFVIMFFHQIDATHLCRLIRAWARPSPHSSETGHRLASHVQAVAHQSEWLKHISTTYIDPPPFSFDTYIKDGIVPILLLLLWILDPSCQIVYQDKFQKGGINKEHADTVPEIHSSQVGHHRELRAESKEWWQGAF